MPLDLWLAFAAASAVMLLIPGPTILLVVAYALGQGRRAAFATIGGVLLGDFTAMTASLAGLGVILAASAEAFTVLKWIGAAYLVWLGVRMWRAPVPESGPEEVAPPVVRRRTMLLHAWIVTALNPKGIVFFVAFLPQFLDPGAPVLPQFALMEATFLTLAVLNAAAYALLASSARRVVRAPRVRRGVNRTGGGLLIGAGVLTAMMRRA
ncbi:LysE family translocator [Caenispirillum salinarum]|uniref:LysE family translocator n=1 Tax=Caenispirillum salinarum TaxID=859058 RepID=UPI00384B3686